MGDSAMPTYRGRSHWKKMRATSQRLTRLVQQQEATQKLYWELVSLAFPSDEEKQDIAWSSQRKPLSPECEMQMHRALVDECQDTVDVVSSYALQFHQVVVNLCADSATGWGRDPTEAVAAARHACQTHRGDDAIIV